MSRKKTGRKGQRNQTSSAKPTITTKTTMTVITPPPDERGFQSLKWATKHIWITTIALFVFSFAVRLILSYLSGPMTVTVMQDEVLYFHIARSIAEQGQILVRDMPTTFQKILYPLILTPAFLLTNNQMAQIDIIRVINCLVMSSVVFPVMLLAKKLTSRKTVIVLSLIFSILLPDMVFSTMIMSEVLQLPLVIWVFYIYICALGEHKLSRKRMLLFALFGFSAYLAFLNKEICAAFIISAAAMLAYEVIHDIKLLKRNVASALCCGAGFFFFFIIMKKTVFNGIGNMYVEQYNMTAMADLNDAYTWYYLFYSAVNIMVAAVMSFYVLPVFFPMLAYKNMDKNNRGLLKFIILTLFIMVGGIAYTISIREGLGDVGNMVPRLHLRFVAYLVIPLVIQCFDFLLSKNPDSDLRTRERLSPIMLIIITVFCSALVFLMQRGLDAGESIAHSSLKIMLELENVNITKGGGELFVNFAWLAFKFLLLLLTVSGIWLVLKGKKRSVLILLISVIMLVSVFDNFYAYREKRYLKSVYYYQNVATQNEGEEKDIMESLLYSKGIQYASSVANALVTVNHYLKEHQGNSMIYLPPQMPFFADIYLDAKIFPADGSFMGYAITHSGTVRLNEFALPDAKGHCTSWDRGLYSFDYIITLKDDNPFTNAEVVYEQSPFIVLANTDPSMLHVEIDGILRTS